MGSHIAVFDIFDVITVLQTKKLIVFIQNLGFNSLLNQIEQQRLGGKFHIVKGGKGVKTFKSLRFIALRKLRTQFLIAARLLNGMNQTSAQCLTWFGKLG